MGVVDLSVVIPVYNESHRLASTLESVCGHLRSRVDSWEVIVVDDGSADASSALVAGLARHEPRIRLLGGHVNRGKGHAVRHGVMASRGHRVLYCDADLATPIGELDRLTDRLDAGYDAAIGARAAETSRIEVKQPTLRIAMGRLGNRLIRSVAVPEFRDTQCGFKLFDGEKARRMFPLTGTNGWGFDVEVLYLFARFGWTVAQVPVRWAHQPGSKVRMLDYPKTLADVIRIRLRHRSRETAPRPLEVSRS